MKPTELFRPERLVPVALPDPGPRIFELARDLCEEPLVGWTRCQKERAEPHTLPVISKGENCEGHWVYLDEWCDRFPSWKRPRIGLLDAIAISSRWQEPPCLHWWDVEEQSTEAVTVQGPSCDVLQPVCFTQFQNPISLRLP